MTQKTEESVDRLLDLQLQIEKLQENPAVAEMQRQIEALQNALITQQQRLNEDPTLVAQRAHPGLDVPPKSYPEGWIVDESMPMAKRKRQSAIAKMQRVAHNRGGFWHPDTSLPRRYVEKWTREDETRWLHALGLKDLTGDMPLVHRTGPDKKTATLEDVIGAFMTREEAESAPGTGRRRVLPVS